MVHLNRRVVLAKRPERALTEECLSVEEQELPPLEEGHVRVQVTHISVDAFIRTTMEEGGFHMGGGLGSVIPAIGGGCVLESRDPGFSVGDTVCGGFGAQTHTTVNPKNPMAGVRKVDVEKARLAHYLGPLGVTTGITAYFGMTEVGAVSAGDVVVVSAAAGAVGSIAAQIAKFKGAGKVIGICGAPDKCAYLTGDLGLDAAIDYKNEDVGARLGELAPDGMDVFFDNVGGEILDTALQHLRLKARVVICGAISQYERPRSEITGPRNYLELAKKGARMQGFVVLHYAAQFPVAMAELAGWLAEGRLLMREDVRTGIDAFPSAMVGLLNGQNTGKMIVELPPPPPSESVEA